MAWFHKTLQDMEKAIEREDWEEVKRILGQHYRYYDQNVRREVEHDISDIALEISEYGQHLNQILITLRAHLEEGANTKDIMQLKVKAAINCTLKFEATMKHLIEEGKFME